jgi:hypothetical protein
VHNEREGIHKAELAIDSGVKTTLSPRNKILVKARVFIHFFHMFVCGTLTEQTVQGFPPQDNCSTRMGKSNSQKMNKAESISIGGHDKRSFVPRTFWVCIIFR